MNPLLRNAYSPPDRVLDLVVFAHVSPTLTWRRICIFLDNQLQSRLDTVVVGSLGVKLGFEQASPRVYRPW